jgi:GTP-binding protein EngB required for normal cell division
VPFLLCVLKNDEIKEDEFKCFKSPQYISYTKDCNNYNDKKQKNIFAQTIISYIIEKQTYFFELDSSFKNLFNPKCFIECNILLMGESRAGKSSFINRVFNKLISHEDANLESVTNSSTQYTFRKGKVGIKFIDTPGIIKKSNIKFIKQILDEYFGKIHLIFFFIKGQSNLENCIEILKYIKLKNEKNVKDGNKKIPILFIKNGEDLEINNETPPFFKYLKGELKMNKIFELYDDKFNQKENHSENKDIEIDDEELFNDNEDIGNNYDNYCEGNIIQIHIPTGKNINKIFWISKEYLIKNNKFLMDEKDNEFIQMKEYTKKLIKFYIKEKIEKNELNKEEKEEKNTLLKRCNNYIDKNKNESSLLNNLETLNIKKGNKFKKGVGIFFALYFIH